MLPHDGASSGQGDAPVVEEPQPPAPDQLQPRPQPDSPAQTQLRPQPAADVSTTQSGPTRHPAPPSGPPPSTTPPDRTSAQTRRPHRVAGRYEIQSKIGTGGMGTVYKVRHVDLGKTFALKIIHSEMSTNPRVREMFYAEARLSSSLEHHNIVSITDFGEDPQRGAYIVMEYLNGEALAERLEKEVRLKFKEACDILLQTADALVFMHGCGVIHGDIKPENIFLCRGVEPHDRRRNHVKVLDFGLSRLSIPYSMKTDEHLTGTPAYLAPERICGAPPDEKSDLYALGVLFYEALTGKVPFDGNVADILNCHLSQPPPPPSQLLDNPNVDERLDGLLLACLAKDPNDRYRTAQDFSQALQRFMSATGIFRRRRNTPLPLPAPRGGDELYKKMIVSNPLPMFAVDADGAIRTANASFALFVKETARRLEGQRLLDTRLGTFAPGLADDLQHVLKHNTVTSRELAFTRPDGRKNVVLVWMAPLEIGGIITGAHGIVHWIQR